MTDRLERTCGGCSASDTHAHHVQYVSFIHPITLEPTDITVSKHIQCCAADGCGICATDVEFAPSKEVGDEFTAHMQAKPDEHLAALTSRHGISTRLDTVADASAAATALTEGA